MSLKATGRPTAFADLDAAREDSPTPISDRTYPTRFRPSGPTILREWTMSGRGSSRRVALILAFTSPISEDTAAFMLWAIRPTPRETAAPTFRTLIEVDMPASRNRCHSLAEGLPKTLFHWDRNGSKLGFARRCSAFP